MGFLSWLKSLFKEKKEEQVVEEKTEPEDYEVVRLLESYDLEQEEVDLEAISNCSEAIQNYIHNLNKDLEVIKSNKSNLQRLDSSISKIRKIVESTLDLENQLNQLIEHYHKPILEILTKVNTIKKNEKIEEQIKKIGEHKQKLSNFTVLLKSFIIFEGMFSTEETSLESLEKEFESKVLSGDLSEKFKDLQKQLNLTINGANGLKQNINLTILKDTEKILYEE